MARILHVLRPSAGGAFGHVRTLSRELTAAGHEVAVCGPAVQADLGLEVPHHAVEMSRDISPRANLRSVYEVARVIRGFRPDLIHAHGSQGGVIARLARPARPRAPLIHTPHQYAFVNYFAGARQQRAYRAVERMLVPLATRVLCVCEDERRLATEIGAGKKARVVYNGVEPLEPAELSAELAPFAQGGGPLVVAVAELHERKGVVSLLEAMAIVRRSHPGARLIVAGEGPERAELEHRREELGLSGEVLFPGHVDGVPGLLTAADVFVNPAWAEAFPYAVLEAMSLGLPSVVTDAGGTAEAIEDGRSGIVVAVRDSAALAAAIESLLSDPVLARRYGDAAKDRALQRFTRKQMVEGTLATYGEVGVA